MNSDEFNATVRPNLERWIQTREPHEAAYLTQLFEQESNFVPHARSGTGAAGLGQITRGTWEDIVSYAARNIPAEELPGDVTYTDLEADDSYDTYVNRPFTNAFMSWANIKRLEAFALDGINDKRLRASDANTPAPSLLEAMDYDPRKWAMVVGAGHKDGMGRMELFTDDIGSFDTAPARAFYRARRENFNARAQSLASEADVFRQTGEIADAEQADRRARALATSDSTGHVFGFGDRLATAVATRHNMQPLEFTPEEYADFSELRAPGHSDDNPAVARFTTALAAIGEAPAEGEQVAGVPGAEVPFRSTLTDAVGRVLTALVPEAEAARGSLPPLPGGDNGEDVSPEQAAFEQAATQSVDPFVGEAQPLTPEQLINSPEFRSVVGGGQIPLQLPPEEQAFQVAATNSSAPFAAANPNNPPAEAQGTPLPQSGGSGLDAFDALIDRAISNQIGSDQGRFDARAQQLRDARDIQAGNLRNQAAVGLQARFNDPLNLPDQSAILASLEQGGPQGDQVGAVLRALNTPITTPTISPADVNAAAGFINNNEFGGFQNAAARDVLGGLSPQVRQSLEGIPLPFEDFGINDRTLRSAQLRALEQQAQLQEFRELSGIETGRIGLAEQTEMNRRIGIGLDQAIQFRRNNFGIR